MAKTFLVAALSVILSLGAAPALADEKKFLGIEPLSIHELSVEKGEGLGGESQAAADDPTRRRGASLRSSVEGGQGTATLNSGQSSQINTSALSASNDLVSITNIAGGGS